MSHSSYSSREPKRLLERAAALMPEGAVMPREQAQALIEKVVKMSKADEVSVNVNSGYQADLRFAANQMSTSGGVVNGTVTVNSGGVINPGIPGAVGTLTVGGATPTATPAKVSGRARTGFHAFRAEYGHHDPFVRFQTADVRCILQ